MKTHFKPSTDKPYHEQLAEYLGEQKNSGPVGRIKKFYYKSFYNFLPCNFIAAFSMAISMIAMIICFNMGVIWLTILFYCLCTASVVFSLVRLFSKPYKKLHYFKVERDRLTKTFVINQLSAKEISKEHLTGCGRTLAKTEMRSIFADLKPDYKYRMITHTNMLHVVLDAASEFDCEYLYNNETKLEKLKQAIRTGKCLSCTTQCGTTAQTDAAFYAVQFQKDTDTSK